MFSVVFLTLNQIHLHNTQTAERILQYNNARQQNNPSTPNKHLLKSTLSFTQHFLLQLFGGCKYCPLEIEGVPIPTPITE